MALIGSVGVKNSTLGVSLKSNPRPRGMVPAAAENPHITFVKTQAALLVEDGYHLIEREATVGAVYIVRNPISSAPGPRTSRAGPARRAPRSTSCAMKKW